MIIITDSSHKVTTMYRDSAESDVFKGYLDVYAGVDVRDGFDGHHSRRLSHHPELLRLEYVHLPGDVDHLVRHHLPVSQTSQTVQHFLEALKIIHFIEKIECLISVSLLAIAAT